MKYIILFIMYVTIGVTLESVLLIKTPAIYAVIYFYLGTICSVILD